MPRADVALSSLRLQWDNWPSASWAAAGTLEPETLLSFCKSVQERLCRSAALTFQPHPPTQPSPAFRFLRATLLCDLGVSSRQSGRVVFSLLRRLPLTSLGAIRAVLRDGLHFPAVQDLRRERQGREDRALRSPDVHLLSHRLAGTTRRWWADEGIFIFHLNFFCSAAPRYAI